MRLSFCSFSSGSSGNCYLVRANGTALLVDAGISMRKIWNGLQATKTEPEHLAGVLITHEHSDHVKSLGSLLKKKKDLPAYANEKTWKAIGDLAGFERRKSFENNEPFTIGDITVKAFQVSHDAADPVGYSFYFQGSQISIVTDTGFIGDELLEEVTEADILVIEANHDVDMLRIGRYPWFLKQRILGDRGHLSNECAGRTLARLLSRRQKERRILLAHLSRENNFPEMAYQTVKNILEEQNYYIGTHTKLSTIVRDEISAVYQV